VRGFLQKVRFLYKVYYIIPVKDSHELNYSPKEYCMYTTANPETGISFKDAIGVWVKYKHAHQYEHSSLWRIYSSYPVCTVDEIDSLKLVQHSVDNRMYKYFTEN